MATGDARVLLINEDNNEECWVRLAEGIASGRAYVTEFHDGLLGFDGDLDDSIERAKVLVGEIEAAGLLAVAWASGRPGHAQVLVICPPEQRSRWQTRGSELGFTHRKRSRPPLAPHRLGLAVSLIHPDDPGQVADRLAPRGNHEAKEHARLTPRTWDRLQNGDPSDPSGSETVFKIVMGALTKNMPIDMIEALLADPTNKGGNAYQRRAAHDPVKARSWLRAVVVPRSREYIKGNRPIVGSEDALAEIEAIRVEARSFPWEPVRVTRTNILGNQVIETVSVTSLRKGLEGILDLAAHQGNLQIAFSNNTMVRLANLSEPTVRKVRQALNRQGWFVEVWAPTTSWAGTYKLAPSTATKNPCPPLATTPVVSYTKAGRFYRYSAATATKGTGQSFPPFNTPPYGRVEGGKR